MALAPLLNGTGEVVAAVEEVVAAEDEVVAADEMVTGAEPVAVADTVVELPDGKGGMMVAEVDTGMGATIVGVETAEV